MSALKPKAARQALFANRAGAGGFSRADIQQMHGAALRVLEELGKAVENPVTVGDSLKMLMNGG